MASPKTVDTDTIAGITTFAAMSYIMFANTAILSPAAANTSFLWASPRAVFFSTCLIAAVASFAAGRLLNLPTALASAMSLNLFTANYAQRYSIPWQYLIAVCGLVASANFVLSALNIRERIIAAVPIEIKIAIPAGVGALLIDLAVQRSTDAATKSGLGRTGALLLFAIGIIVIFGIQYWEAISKRETSMFKHWVITRQIINAVTYLVAIIVILCLYLLLAPLQEISVTGRDFWPWSQGWPSSPGFFESVRDYWGYGFVVAFIMILDIAGSPTEFVDRDGCTLSSEDKAQARRKSYLIDSGFNVLAAIMGITPIVYYAENHAGWRAGGRTGKVAVIVAIGFVLSAIFVLFCIWMGWKITEFIPPFVVMPTLFVVGIILVAESFTTPIPIVNDNSQPEKTEEDDALARIEGIFRFVPAAVVTVLVPITHSLDVALAAGIVSHMLTTIYFSLGGQEREHSFAHGVIYLGGVAMLIYQLGGFMER